MPSIPYDPDDEAVRPVQERSWDSLVASLDAQILRELLGRLDRMATATMSWAVSAQTGLGHRDFHALMDIRDGKRP